MAKYTKFNRAGIALTATIEKVIFGNGTSQWQTEYRIGNAMYKRKVVGFRESLDIHCWLRKEGFKEV